MFCHSVYKVIKNKTTFCIESSCDLDALAQVTVCSVQLAHLSQTEYLQFKHTVGDPHLWKLVHYPYKSDL